jgi:hypothetical protein
VGDRVVRVEAETVAVLAEHRQRCKRCATRLGAVSMAGRLGHGGGATATLKVDAAWVSGPGTPTWSSRPVLSKEDSMIRDAGLSRHDRHARGGGKFGRVPRARRDVATGVGDRLGPGRASPEPRPARQDNAALPKGISALETGQRLGQQPIGAVEMPAWRRPDRRTGPIH